MASGLTSCVGYDLHVSYRQSRLSVVGYPNVRAGFVNALHRLYVSMSRSRDDPVRRAINMEEGQCAATRFEAGQSVYAFLGLRL